MVLDERPEGVGARLVLVLGGARSGKSAFAERLAVGSGQTVAFIATATAGDAEMRARIERHQLARPQSWRTLEEPLDLPGVVRRASMLADMILLDCLTLWTANWLTQQADWTEGQETDTSWLFGESALKEIDTLLEVLRTLPTHQTLIAISNEVGLGLVPTYALGRVYRDTLGYVNQRIAQAAERVYLMVAGLAVDLKRLQAGGDWL